MNAPVQQYNKRLTVLSRRRHADRIRYIVKLRDDDGRRFTLVTGTMFRPGWTYFGDYTQDGTTVRDFRVHCSPTQPRTKRG